MKWEYRVSDLKPYTGIPADLRTDLNIAGSDDSGGIDGWELVQILRASNTHYVCVYKRKLA